MRITVEERRAMMEAQMIRQSAIVTDLAIFVRCGGWHGGAINAPWCDDKVYQHAVEAAHIARRLHGPFVG